jgi:hypothetical protein
MHYPESNITIAMWTNGDGGEQDTIFANFQDAVDKLVFPSNP